MMKKVLVKATFVITIILAILFQSRRGTGGLVIRFNLCRWVTGVLLSMRIMH